MKPVRQKELAKRRLIVLRQLSMARFLELETLFDLATGK